MSTSIRRIITICLAVMFTGTSFALANSETSIIQTEISGTITDVAGEPLAGVNVRVDGKLIGTVSGVNGEFSLTVNQDPPLRLIFSIVGFKSVTVDITDAVTEGLRVEMEEQTIFGDDVVVSASRVEESILKSPVSIEKLDVLDIQTAAATNFYDAISNLKGVDFSTQSLTFSSVNTRGFNANGNTRFVQLIDGIDNQAPGLNFSVGNIVGISELDLATAELLPGAASALYGPNAINGILLLNSKSPFEFEGFTFNTKLGVNHIDSNVENDPQLYQSYSMRFAKSFNNKFAFKVNASYLRAQDFVAQDYRDQSGLLERGATSRAEAAVPRLYNGVSVYGDPTVTVGLIADAAIAAGNAPGASAEAQATAAQLEAVRTLIPDGLAGAFTPRGYTENSFVDNTTESLKLGGALHYRVNDVNELVAQYNIGYGSTVYTANDRFVLDDFSIWTGKLELRNPNYTLRAYTTQEDAGDTYAANTLASLINQRVYFPNYLGAFVQARTTGATVDEAHLAARSFADANQPAANSETFRDLQDEIRSIPISEGGARFLDKSDLYHAEGQYNFSNIIDPEVVQVIAGANVRRYALESDGTLFALQDNGDEFDIDEWGAFTQVSKNFNEVLDLTGSVRYDKNEYFDGQFSPRLSAILTLGGVHNIRASFQRGFRIPTTQDQFIDLDVVSRRLVGSNPALIDRYRFESNPVYSAEEIAKAQAAIAGGASVSDAAQGMQEFVFDDFQPEKISTFEVGYKALIGGKLFIDAYYYFSNYTDFIAERTFTQGVPNGLREQPGSQYTVGSPAWKVAILTGVYPGVGAVPTQSYGFDVNAGGNVRSNGWALTAEYSLPKGFSVGGNVAYNKLLDQDDLLEQGFNASYNTPEWRYNLNFQNRKLTDNIGFKINYRWQDAFLWESSIGKGVIPAFGTMDAQVSYKLSKYNTIMKLGGSNILNERYETSLANPTLGAIYYISFTFDQFLN
ncbi:TonB-dependent receptor [Balneola sp. MJW-20]|uniref:TonB-dependent receptor n=1 Tax=Gracilimonas aurantiaca TaxID=3234185 RepID=UPI0034663F4B